VASRRERRKAGGARATRGKGPPSPVRPRGVARAVRAPGGAGVRRARPPPFAYGKGDGNGGASGGSAAGGASGAGAGLGH